MSSFLGLPDGKNGWRPVDPRRFAWVGAGPAVLFRLLLGALVVFLLVVLVRDIAGFGAFWGLGVAEMFGAASIDPRDRRGFEFFLRLFLLESAF